MNVHALVEPWRGAALAVIVQAWKAISARESGLAAPVWQANYFDRYMRDEAQLAATIAYIEANPVAARLATHPSAWRWSSAYAP